MLLQVNIGDTNEWCMIEYQGEIAGKIEGNSFLGNISIEVIALFL